MFNLQGSELIIVLLLALVVLGPEKLPGAMRKLGEFIGQLKKMTAGFQDEFKAATDEPMRELRDTASALRDSVDFRKFTEGERPEKPKTAEMADNPLATDVAAADPDLVPTDDVPFDPIDVPAESDPDATDGPGEVA